MGIFGKLFRLALGAGVAFLLGLAALFLVDSFSEPRSTLMFARWAEGESVARYYVSLRRISPHLRAAVIASEDARFCQNDGVDWGALREVIDESDADGPSRGASTITMQTAKNLFLWPSRSFVRKGIEIPLALLINLAWSKRRVLEVYLNVAEWGEGVFGAEAAAQLYFHKSAEYLDPRESALLATALPNPRLRHPARPSRGHAALAHRLLERMRAGRFVASCAE